ncbi:CDP-diacylglycerol--glycerol-3-phosphate 3-phosphatidyltransferase, mitochondrial-like [Saccoglossus kowalevskii]
MGNMAGACLRLLQGLFRKEAITRASIGVRQYHQQSSLGENMDPVFQEFSWISRFAPVFAVNGDQVTILREPSEFYKTLKEKARHARNRIVLASLYLGTGELEQQLVDSIHEAAKNSTHSLHIQILLEYTRGSRGKHNSRTMLLPLLREYGSNVNISLYHSPDLRGMLKRFVPARLNEAIGLHHMKIYLFDDSLIISGANLENQYFTNRQDRYILLEDCPQVANFFTQLVSTVSGFSFQLHEDDSVSMKEDFGIHPFTGDIKMFKQEAERRVRSLLDAHQQFTKLTTTKLHNVSNIETVNKTNILPELRTRKVAGNAGSVCIDDIEERTIKKQETIHSTDSSNKLDTLIYPLIQMGPLGITNDEEATMYLLENSPCGSRIHLASGYFNLTESYIDIVLNKSKAFFNILSAAPQVRKIFVTC